LHYCPLPLQLLLCVSDDVFPALAKMNTVDDSVDRVIAEVRVYPLYQRVKLDRQQRSALQNMDDRSRENPGGGFAGPRPDVKQRLLCLPPGVTERCDLLSSG